jgi:hypothetical protein
LRRALGAFVLAAGLLLAACLPPQPQQPPAAPVSNKPLPNPPTVAQGFDACAAPASATMGTWWTSSPFTSVGVYIGGANRGCKQPNLTSSWVTSVIGQGWKLLPIWVGRQASCTKLTGTTKLSPIGSVANSQGAAEATSAADAANALGFTWLAPIYFDMEAYTQGGACSGSVQSFTNGWIYTLHQRGYRAGFYSSLCSGIQDQAATYDNGLYYRLDSIWIAAWNNTPNIFGFNSTCPLSDLLWPAHQRVHQFQGGHYEVWGGVKINIDSNAVDGTTFPG